MAVQEVDQYTPDLENAVRQQELKMRRGEKSRDQEDNTEWINNEQRFGELHNRNTLSSSIFHESF